MIQRGIQFGKKDTPLMNGQIVSLQNTFNNQYLLSTDVKLTSGSKQYMIGTTPLFNDKQTHWRVQIANPILDDIRNAKQMSHENEAVYMGDTVHLVNFANNCILTMDRKNNSQGKLGGEVYGTTLLPHVATNFWTLAYANEPDITDENFDARIYNGQEIKLVNAGDSRSLQSSSEFYSQKEISEYKEVFVNDNTHGKETWYIYIVQSLNLVPLVPKSHSIRHLDQIIIKNVQLGYCLNSSKVFYKKSKMQMVKGGSINRDKNDLWTLAICKKEDPTHALQRSNSQLSSYLTKQTYFSLVHFTTNTILTHTKGQSHEGNTPGLEVSCQVVNQIPDEWKIEALYTQQDRELHCGDLFLIKHTQTNHYLAMTDKKCKSYQYQLECLLMKEPSSVCFWTVETVCSN